MCTLSFIPQPNNGFLLTSNRDEATARKPALAPDKYIHNGIELVYPKDTQGSGTWLASANNGITLCLLNGAFTKHKHLPPYKHSRGLVVLDFFKYNQVEAFLSTYAFDGIEPFTLIVVNAAKAEVHEIRWDGIQTTSTLKEWGIPHIWSSSTLYEPEIIVQRGRWFHEFLEQNSNVDLNQILHFHHFGGNGDEANRFLMNRDNVLKTVSITGIKKCNAQTMMHHEDLLNATQSVIQLSHQQ